MLLHDIEKPSCLSIGKDGQHHFHGHQEKGASTAKRILRRLKFDNDTIDSVVHLIRWHDHRFELTPAGMRRTMSKIGKEYMPLLFEVYRADSASKNPIYAKKKLEQLEEARMLYQGVLDREECVNLKELNINGNDLIAMGMKRGKQIGEVLAYLLEQVLENPGLNDKDILLDMARASTI
jgi:tRNA nucleotidyltransferase (CCA-adding enzyme)